MEPMSVPSRSNRTVGRRGPPLDCQAATMAIAKRVASMQRMSPGPAVRPAQRTNRREIQRLTLILVGAVVILDAAVIGLYSCRRNSGAPDQAATDVRRG